MREFCFLNVKNGSTFVINIVELGAYINLNVSNSVQTWEKFLRKPQSVRLSLKPPRDSESEKGSRRAGLKIMQIKL